MSLVSEVLSLKSGAGCHEVQPLSPPHMYYVRSAVGRGKARLEKLALGVASGKCATLVAFAAEPGHK